jgi:hypothetical protein
MRIPGNPRWGQSARRLREIGWALHTYHDVHGQFPPAAVTDKDGRPLYSWRVAILPYLEDLQARPLAREFRRDEPWDSPHNHRLLPQMPAPFALPWEPAEGRTHYQVVVGPGTAFDRPGLKMADFPDGPDNTVLVVEARDSVPWTKPADVGYDPAGPLPAMGGLCQKPYRKTDPRTDRAGFNACFLDLKVRFVGGEVPPETIRGLLTRNGGEATAADQLEPGW